MELREARAQISEIRMQIARTKTFRGYRSVTVGFSGLLSLAGALLTFVLAMFAAESLWMLPGLWSVVFSLGVFASCRLLPRASF